MTRLHIPFRAGEASNLTASHIRTLAAQFRQDVLDQYAKDWPGSDEPSLSVQAALRMLGGRLHTGSMESNVPLDQSLSLEVWGPKDFVLYECPVVNRGSALLSFAFIGSYLMHFLNCPEKWISEDGSPIGMQWSMGMEGPSALKDLARQEAYAFAWEVAAPYDAVKNAIKLMGEENYYMPFAGILRKAQVEHRARALGLIAHKDTAA